MVRGAGDGNGPGGHGEHGYATWHGSWHGTGDGDESG